MDRTFSRNGATELVEAVISECEEREVSLLNSTHVDVFFNTTLCFPDSNFAFRWQYIVLKKSIDGGPYDVVGDKFSPSSVPFLIDLSRGKTGDTRSSYSYWQHAQASNRDVGWKCSCPDVPCGHCQEGCRYEYCGDNGSSKNGCLGKGVPRKCSVSGPSVDYTRPQVVSGAFKDFDVKEGSTARYKLAVQLHPKNYYLSVNPRGTVSGPASNGFTLGGKDFHSFFVV